MIHTAIILAGGFGTRLQTVVNDVPKPMAPINNLPFLNYILFYLKHFGIKKVVLSTSYLSHKISDYYKNQFNGIDITYTIEKEPLGTGGGIRLAMENCLEHEILVLNGDSFFDFNLNEFYKEHLTHQSDFSLALRQVENASRYGTIELNQSSKIVRFKEKDGQNKPGLINAGVYILNKSLFLMNTQGNSVFSIEKDFYEKQLETLNIFGFKHEGYFIDIGIPEDYKKAQDDFKGFTY